MSGISPDSIHKTGDIPKPDKYSKDNRWYYKDLEDHLKPSSRSLLERYSRIPPNDVDAHVYKMRDLLWSYAPYPCIGEFKFLTLNLPSHPHYSQILSLLQPSSLPPSSSSDTVAAGPFLLDLGCCVAQELRSLTDAGIPSSHLYGSDVQAKFLDTSYQLFNDTSSFAGKLIPANIFSPTLFSDAFARLEHKFRVVHAGLFLHLFSWEQQLVVCENIVKLLDESKGSVFVGEMVGCEGGGERGEGQGSKFWKKGEERKQFLHDEKSFAKMWGDIAKHTDTAGKWKVEARFKLRGQKAGGGSKGCAFFVGEGIGWLTFCVERANS